MEAFMQQSYYGSQGLGIDILQTAIVSAILVFGSNIDRIISKSLGEKNSGFPLSSSCFRSFCNSETFSREDAWSCCFAIKTLWEKKFSFPYFKEF